MSQNNKLYNGKPIQQATSRELTKLALEDAKQNYLRLRDDYTLAAYDVLQEYPHTFEWRQTQMDKINQLFNQSKI
jgi:hypothetical protein